MKADLPLDCPVTEFLSEAAFTLRDNFSVDQSLHHLRTSHPPTDKLTGAKAQVVYFYVLDDGGKLVGILPARKLILAPGHAIVGDIMHRDIIAMRSSESLVDALELFAIHRLLAIPVVDAHNRFLGIVEISLYTDEVFDLAQNRQLNEVFQLIGLRLEQHKQGSPLKGFRLRMPWLVSNITGGLLCAALGSFFEATVAKVVLIALFIPLILTLAESIAMQSMTLAIEQAMAGKKFNSSIRTEAATALLLGLCSGLIVGVVSLFWCGPLSATLTIGGSVTAVMILAAVLGQTVPKAVRALKMNTRVASGPITLAIVDVVTITVYLSSATLVLGR